MKRFPQSIRDGLFQWRVQVQQPDHFRAIRYVSLRGASRDEKALAFFGLLFFIAGTAFAVKGMGELLNAAHRVWVQPRPVSWSETAIWLVIVGLWLGVAYGMLSRVWVLEARPGMLRVGWHVWKAGDGRALELARHSKRVRQIITTEWSMEPDLVSLSTLTVRAVGPGQRPRKVWVFHGRQKARVETWLRHMAHLAGVPVVEA